MLLRIVFQKTSDSVYTVIFPSKEHNREKRDLQNRASVREVSPKRSYSGKGRTEEFMGRLQDKVAIVTGASRGIGRAIAEAFAREGAQVVICGRKQEVLDQVAREIGKGITAIACHVGRPEQIQNLVDSTTKQFGRVDILVNNAATNIAQEPCLDVDDTKFDKMVEINLKSAFRLIRQVAPGMCQRGSGSIINIASISGLRPQYYGLLYSMTKAALIMMTQSYALELGPKGVRVNAIAPGLVQTV